ncbi:family 1 glycosylhydrolase [Microbacterium sp.]|uniref:family 1 glycosylhydrolase n=1 Tax=Microbacterium sp. TaxID=51671 RepID=UPI003A92E3CF
MPATTFPASFYWGVATAGHQNEGDNVNSDTWFLENVTPTVFQERSGRATNGWELWESDLDLAVAMHLNAYRFSVEWARVEPVQGSFSEEALDHYEAMVDGCLARGLAPLVTFNHFTSPHWFAKEGGWLNPEAPSLFARYCGVVMERFGDRIALAVTFNEPNLPELLTWVNMPEFVANLQRATLEAASEAAGVERYRAGNVMLKEDFADMRAGMTNGHRAAKDVIKSHRPDLPVGLSIAIVDDVAIAGGETVRDQKRAEVYDHWLELAKDDDFIGVQNYEREIYGPDGSVPPQPGVSVNAMGTAVEPDSLRGAVEYAYEVSGVPVLVSEHGIATDDDSLRASFIEPSLKGLLQAIETGTPVLGYCHWTLMDNFEWVGGYGPKLGLHAVDRETFHRTPKPSAGVYGSLVKAARAERATMSTESDATPPHIGPRPPYDAEAGVVVADMPDFPPLTVQSIPQMRAGAESFMPRPTNEELEKDGEYFVEERTVAGPLDAPDVTLIVCRPTRSNRPTPVLFYIHGGGMFSGTARDVLSDIVSLGQTIGAAVVSVEYRLAPETQHTGPVEDCYAGLIWTITHAAEIGADPEQVVLIGGSAGAGLAAGVALLSRDIGAPPLKGQILMSPMLDDRNNSASVLQMASQRMWNQADNEVGWTALLGAERSDDISPYAAPARATDLSGLPPTFIDVGSADSFRDEDVLYATRIWAAGGVAELHVWPGGFHGFDSMAPQAMLSRAAVQARVDWLGRLFRDGTDA